MNRGLTQTCRSLQVPPRLSEAHNRNSAWVLLGFAILAAIAGVLFFFDPAVSRFYPGCFLYQTTSLLCPGCGGLRAMHHLLHGHVIEAMHYNILLVATLPFFLVFMSLYFLRNLRKQPVSFHIRPKWLWAGLMLLLIFGALRNFPFAKAVWLAP